MGWTEIRDAIQAAIVAASGLPADRVIWKPFNSDAPPVDYVAISLGGLIGVGQDRIDKSTDLGRPAGQEIKLEVHGLREAALQIECFTASTADSADALALGDRIRTSLILPSIRDALAAVGFVPFDPSPALSYVPEIVAIKFRGRSLLQVRCYVPAQTVADYIGYIASVGGTVTTTGGAQNVSSTRPFVIP